MSRVPPIQKEGVAGRALLPVQVSTGRFRVCHGGGADVSDVPSVSSSSLDVSWDASADIILDVRPLGPSQVYCSRSGGVARRAEHGQADERFEWSARDA